MEKPSSIIVLDNIVLCNISELQKSHGYAAITRREGLKNGQSVRGPAKRRVMKWRVISESYDFEELCANQAHFFKTTTPNFLTLLMFT